MTDDNPLVYLDCETTGLDVKRHQVWEVAWAVGDGDIESLVVRHTIDGADPRALKVNGYLDRVDPEAPWPTEVPLEFALKGATVVGANPAFDTKFLAQRWNWEPWHHRLLDIETYAMPALGLDRPRGFAMIAEALGVQAPDHSAAGDVYTLRECHRALVRWYSEEVR